MLIITLSRFSKLFCLFTLFTSTIHARDAISQDTNFPLKNINHYTPKSPITKNKTVAISIPKSGTHLLLKCITLFKVKGLVDNYAKECKPSPKHLQEIRRINKNSPPNHYKGLYYDVTKNPLPPLVSNNLVKKNAVRRLLWTHWPYTKQFEKLLDQYSYANFITIRDPRDMVVSFAFMVHENREGTRSEKVEDVILDLITAKKQHYMPWAVEIHEGYPLLWEIGLEKYYRLYLPWFKSKNFMIIRFEDLIGDKGGGSAVTQFETVMKIGKHLNINMTPEKARNVIDQLFGGTWTFREGQIGSWKKHFTPAITKAFKSQPRLMQLLVDLGYEKDTSW